MHSFRPSRSRILFEVFCALAISASCVGAWMQTGAWALLPAAAVAALYSFVHAFDLPGRKPHTAVDQPESEGSKDTLRVAAAQPVAAIQQPVTAIASEEIASDVTESVEPAAPRKRQTSRAKTRRKGGGRQAADAADEAKVPEFAPPAEAEVALPMATEEVAHLHIEPLFEAKPFARMPHRAFGRKSG